MGWGRVRRFWPRPKEVPQSQLVVRTIATTYVRAQAGDRLTLTINGNYVLIDAPALPFSDAGRRCDVTVTVTRKEPA